MSPAAQAKNRHRRQHADAAAAADGTPGEKQAHGRPQRPPAGPGRTNVAQQSSSITSTTAVKTTATTPLQNAAVSTSSPSSTRKTTPAPHSSPKGKPSSTKGAKASTTPSHTSLPSSGGSSSTKHAVITAVAVLVSVAALAVIAFFVRRYYIKRRQAKSSAWRTNVRHSYSDDAAARANPAQAVPLLNEKPLVPIPIDPLVAPPPPAGIPDFRHRPTSVSSAAPSTALGHAPLVPQSPALGALNAAVAIPQPPMSPAPSTARNGTGVSREPCIVCRTFMPTLPDELSVTAGERVAILQAFDDGWASCVNVRGEQGVVPLECLQRLSELPADEDMHEQDGGAWRLSRRASSLYGGTAPGTY